MILLWFILRLSVFGWDVGGLCACVFVWTGLGSGDPLSTPVHVYKAGRLLWHSGQMPKYLSTLPASLRLIATPTRRGSGCYQVCQLLPSLQCFNLSLSFSFMVSVLVNKPPFARIVSVATLTMSEQVHIPYWKIKILGFCGDYVNRMHSLTFHLIQKRVAGL